MLIGSIMEASQLLSFTFFDAWSIQDYSDVCVVDQSGTFVTLLKTLCRFKVLITGAGETLNYAFDPSSHS